MRKKKLCFAAISGNEEDFAEQWCKSIMKAKPDYVVFNLTKYDDHTEEIVRANIPKEILTFVKYPWKDNFSEARNQGLKHVPADTDYIMYLDLDEVITEESYPILEMVLNDDNMFLHLVTIYNTLEAEGMLASLFYPRLFPWKDKNGNPTNARFESSVHNQLVLKDPSILTVRTPVSILHYGYSLNPEKMKEKHKRSEDLLRKQIEDEPNSFFSCLNLAQLLRAKGDFVGTEFYAREVLRIIEPKLITDRDKYLHAYIMSKEQLTTALMAQHKFDGVVDLINDVLNIKPDHLDSILNMGNIHLELKQYDKAEFWYKRYLFVRSKYDETRDNTNLILNHLNSSFIASYNLGITRVYQNDWKGAKDYFKKCVDETPKFKDAFIKYIHCLRTLGEEKEMHQEVGKYMSKYPDKSHMVYEYFGDIELENTNIELAKFNYSQGAFINDKSEENRRIKTKYESILGVFGDVSSVFFNTDKVCQRMADKVC